jgi:hypothetical protein
MRPALLTLLLALPLPAAAQDLPPAVAAFTEQAMAECRGAGGDPSLADYYATAAELNGDGVTDWVINFDALNCAGAWSYFCGSAGCPVSVWLSGPAGHENVWGSHAQAVRIEGQAVVASLHGQLCDPPRTGSDGCEERLTFTAAAAPAPAPAPAPQAAAPAPAPSGPPPAPGWTLRAVPNSTPVAVAGGTGSIRSLAAFCLSGQPWLAVLFHEPPGPEELRIDFGFSQGTIGGPARREESAGGAYVIGLADQPLAGLLAGRDSRATVVVDGAAQGQLSLSGSSRAIHGALATCHAF